MLPRRSRLRLRHQLRLQVRLRLRRLVKQKLRLRLRLRHRRRLHLHRRLRQLQEEQSLNSVRQAPPHRVHRPAPVRRLVRARAISSAPVDIRGGRKGIVRRATGKVTNVERVDTNKAAAIRGVRDKVVLARKVRGRVRMVARVASVARIKAVVRVVHARMVRVAANVVHTKAAKAVRVHTGRDPVDRAKVVPVASVAHIVPVGPVRVDRVGVRRADLQVVVKIGAAVRVPRGSVQMGRAATNRPS